MQTHDEKKLAEAIAKLPGGRQIPLFPGYMQPYGYLSPARECHALFYYYLCAMRVYENEIVGERIVYEGEQDPIYKFRNLFTSLAALYNVSSEKMAAYWDLVDAQADLMMFPRLPDEEKYRFNTPSNIIQ